MLALEGDLWYDIERKARVLTLFRLRGEIWRKEVMNRGML